MKVENLSVNDYSLKLPEVGFHADHFSFRIYHSEILFMTTLIVSLACSESVNLNWVISKIKDVIQIHRVTIEM